MTTKKLFSSFLLLCLTTSYPSQAAEYKLVKGSAFELCKVFEQNLNSFKDDPPMVCERKINPQFKDFALPKWKPVEPEQTQKYQAMIYQAYKEKGYTFGGPAGEVRMWQARFDLGHDGQRETVIKVVDNFCSPERDFGFPVATDPSIYVISADGNNLDPVHSRLVSGDSRDVIFYQGLAYLVNWTRALNADNQDSNPDGHIYVYDTFMARGKFGITNRPICKYDYYQ